MDDGKLIEAVRNHPEFYDKRHAGFKNPAIKQTGWSSVAQIVKAPAADCITRWNTLRERYNKEKRKMELEGRSGSGIPTSPWPLFASMEFLAPHIRKRKAVSNFPNDTSSHLTVVDEDDSLPMYDESGQLLVSENDSTTDNTVAPITTVSVTSANPPTTDSSPSPVPSVQQDSSRPGSSTGSPYHPSGSSLPYLGPRGRIKKRKPDEATLLFKETLSNLNKSIEQSNKEPGQTSNNDNKLDSDACIARNVEASLKSLPMSLKIIYRRKFRDLIQDCEEALYAHESSENSEKF